MEETEKIKGSCNDPLYVSKQRYHIAISLQVDVTNVLTEISLTLYVRQFCFELLKVAKVNITDKIYCKREVSNIIVDSCISITKL